MNETYYSKHMLRLYIDNEHETLIRTKLLYRAFSNASHTQRGSMTNSLSFTYRILLVSDWLFMLVINWLIYKLRNT